MSPRKEYYAEFVNNVGIGDIEVVFDVCRRENTTELSIVN